jgi:glucosamine--fructose-6-phosphate aminotransferase (isomerizing)
MCGIVGYFGEARKPKDVIISGLKKLEYRGYDSAGVCILDEGHFKRIRAPGKLKVLEAKLENETFSGKLGIGHTRWATHGAPNERNAHPHQVNDISLVHNGIIENYLEIREELLQSGAQINSDTDSELVAHLIAREVAKTKDLLKAVQNVRTHLRGAFSILVIWEQSPNEMIAFKDGPPLVVGIGENETFVASDVQALLQYTKKFVYLEDQQLAHIKNNNIKYYDKINLEIHKEIIELNWSLDLVEKQGFPHYMLKEIYEQPRAVAAAIESHVNIDSMTLHLSEVDPGLFHNIQRIFIIACGTSYYAAQIGKYLIEKIAKIPVETDIASEFRYRSPVIPKNSLVVTISQSGETADTLAALRLAKSLHAKTLSICNVKNSSIDREADAHLYMASGPEIGVASTKAFVATLALLNVLAVFLGRQREVISHNEEAQYIQNLLTLPALMEGVLAYDKYFSQAARALKSFKGFLYMGRGVHFPIAMEGALKLKELAYLHAEGYAAGEMKHGPLALIDERMGIVMIAPVDDVYEKSISNLEEARARGGKIITISTGENEKLRAISEYYLALPKAHWSTNPILATIPLQLMAYHLASALGHDVDQPRNLAKSVTVE